MNVEILQQKGYKFLWVDDELWMWDIPAEAKIQKEIAYQASGNILVIGYGLGVMHRFLEINEKIESITTIEKHQEVIQECKKVGIPIIGDILIGDFFALSFDNYFDYVIGDIWIDIVPSALSSYKKFKKRALRFLYNPEDKRILAWGKDYFEYLINKEKK